MSDQATYSPLAEAIRALLESRSGWSLREWAGCLTANPQDIAGWTKDRAIPSSTQVVFLLGRVEHALRSATEGAQAEVAFNHFWDLMQRYEDDGSEMLSPLVPYGGGPKSRAQRAAWVTAFTTPGLGELETQLSQIPARQRGQFLEAVRDLTGRYLRLGPAS